MSTLERFGERIVQQRKKLHLTQAELAKRVGMSDDSRTTIAKWERGSQFPSCWVIPDLCAALECDAGYLFGEFDQPRKVAADIQEETGLSDLAVENLRIAASAPFDGPMEGILKNAPHDNLRNLEIGRFAKIRFIEAVLENPDELERLAVAAYDYRMQTQQSKQDPLKMIEGIRHDQFASLAKETAKEALADLFEQIKWDVMNGPEWGEGQ